jgi:hypothetical protein
MAGDLSSHIYNAWLTTLVRQGQAPGVELRPVLTNVAFDLALEALLVSVGPELAQRIAVSAAVIIFAGGIFWFIREVSRRPSWFVLPFVMVLSYGWTFHMGFFNYMISAGCSLAAFAALIPARTRSRVGAAALFIAIGCSAHPFPVLSIGGLALYWFAARCLRPRWRVVLFCSAIVAIVIVREILLRHFAGGWSAQQYISAIGAGQLWVFGPRSFLFVPAAFAIWTLLFLRLTWAMSFKRLFLRVPTQVALLTAAATYALPTYIATTEQTIGLSYIADRMAVIVAVCVLAVLSRARPRVLDVVLGSVLWFVFYASVYTEARRLNAIEDKIEAAVRVLPPRVRVTAPMFEYDRTNQTGHMIDRACVGRCFSYANYEPTALGFRLKVVGNSPIVARTYAMSVALQTGTYQPQPSDWPFYKLDVHENGERVLTTFIEAAAPSRPNRFVSQVLLFQPQWNAQSFLSAFGLGKGRSQTWQEGDI